MKLVLIPLGALEPGVIARVRNAVAAIVPWKVETAEGAAISALAASGQVNARDAVSRLPFGRRDRLVMGITGHDLTIQGYNFVFGYAVPGRYCAIVSLNRLRNSEVNGPDQLMLLERAVKEVLHEAGHLLGLGHCLDANCVMHYSQALQDTDIKSERFCPVCARELSRLPESSHEG